MKPVIKWAGGKTQLLDILKANMPEKYNFYYEPFVGAGALFLNVAPEKAFINDFNKQLIMMYNNIKKHHKTVIKELTALQEQYNSLASQEARASFYYQKRERYNEIIKKNTIENTVLLIFLNKTCFNGLYRVNSNGNYNVPFGKKTRLNIVNEETSKNIEEISNHLQETTITNLDFEKAVETAKKGDFVYFDPPYYDTWVGYQKGGFDENEQIRLANLFKELTKKGVHCMLSNSNSDFIKELYKDFNIEVIQVKRMINRNGNDRTGEEVIIKNY